MVRGVYFLSTLRMFKKQLTRFLTLVAIIIVSVGFMSGLGEVEEKINNNFHKYYVSQNISDLTIKSGGILSASNKQYLLDTFGEENVMFGFYNDYQIDDSVFRVYILNLDVMKVNKFKLVRGILPTVDQEILVEEGSKGMKSFDLRQEVELNDPQLQAILGGNTKFYVSGIVKSPMFLIKDKEPSIISGKDVDYCIYINRTNSLLTTDAYIALENRDLFNSFSKDYEKKIEELKTSLSEKLGVSKEAILSLYENYGIFSLHAYAEKVGDIAIIFVIFFLLVTSLVVFSTMTRLIDEERGQIACLKTLGYTNTKILGKYLLFMLLSCVIGGAIGLPVGIALTYLIYASFDTQYFMPQFVSGISITYFVLTLGIIILASLLVTYFTGLKLVRNKPATLLTPKAPKSGKKVFLEHIPFVWNRLSFKYKSSFRNVLLFKSRFFMTVISIIGSTVLVLSGLGLLDNTIKLSAGSALIMLAVALIIFAGILSALVIYNLANINISERSREISTLMVLGYNNSEVTGYIFREIYIMSIIGALLGIPLAFWFMSFVFGFIDFGTVGDVNWFTWIVGPIATIFFTFISTLLLRKKITKTDMNASLKIVD